jgi:hypothetical protein
MVTDVYVLHTFAIGAALMFTALFSRALMFAIGRLTVLAVMTVKTIGI